MNLRLTTRRIAVAIAGIAVAATAIPTASAAGSSAEAAAPCEQYTICVISPSYGASVDGATTISFEAPGLRNVAARAWHQPDSTNSNPNGYDKWFVQSVVPSTSGATSVSLDADDFPAGPLTVLLSGWDAPPGDPGFENSDNVYLSLYNEGGVSWRQGVPTVAPPPAAGMKLAFEDDFDGPLSTSRTGAGADYASVGPYQQEQGGAEFGDAQFADQAGANNPFAVLGGEHLRIRASRAPADFVDPKGWNRQYTSGLLSSLRQDGSGFATRHGYFETRFMAPGGYGTFPAFWLMSTNRVTEGLVPVSELDIVEQHGQSISMKRSAHTSHCWRCDPETHENHVSDAFPPGTGDAGQTWHVYGAKVTPSEVVYYLDGVEVWRHATPDPAQGEMFFMVDLALGGGWPVDLSSQGDKADMYVDYIRVYEPR